jgi:chromosome segregation ATPase
MSKKSSLFMTEKQENTFGPKGSNPNPEIYQGIKKEEESTPLSMDAFQAGYGAEIYASNREGLQNMFNQLTNATVKAVQARKDPEAVADRLEKRVAKREKKSLKKYGPSNDELKNVNKAMQAITGNYSNFEKDIKNNNPDKAKFDKKTAKIKSRLTSAKEKAKKAMEKRIQDAAALRGSKTNEEKIADARELKELLNKPENKGLQDLL